MGNNWCDRRPGEPQPLRAPGRDRGLSPVGSRPKASRRGYSQPRPPGTYATALPDTSRRSCCPRFLTEPERGREPAGIVWGLLDHQGCGVRRTAIRFNPIAKEARDDSRAGGNGLQSVPIGPHQLSLPGVRSGQRRRSVDRFHHEGERCRKGIRDDCRSDQPPGSRL
jgi:hypothetical protein